VRLLRVRRGCAVLFARAGAHGEGTWRDRATWNFQTASRCRRDARRRADVNPRVYSKASYEISNESVMLALPCTNAQCLKFLGESNAFDHLDRGFLRAGEITKMTDLERTRSKFPKD